jgi:hypothetical protein
MPCTQPYAAARPPCSVGHTQCRTRVHVHARTHTHTHTHTHAHAHTHARACMRTHVSRYDVEAVGAQVDGFVVDLAAALDALRCGQLQYLLALVRDVANMMNGAGAGASAVLASIAAASCSHGGGAGAPPRAAVQGFRLESLSRLQVRARVCVCVGGGAVHVRARTHACVCVCVWLAGWRGGGDTVLPQRVPRRSICARTTAPPWPPCHQPTRRPPPHHLAPVHAHGGRRRPQPAALHRGAPGSAAAGRARAGRAARGAQGRGSARLL